MAGFVRARFAGTASPSEPGTRYSVVHTDAEWRRILGPQAGTELPFFSPLLHEERAGIFNCAGCALPLYSSATKYDSGTGWPSFWNHLPGAILAS